MDDKHDWFYKELKEIPKEVFENFPVKTENDFYVGIPVEKKTKISDIVDVKINIEPAGFERKI